MAVGALLKFATLRGVLADRVAAGGHGHPIVESFEPGDDWRWCSVDEQFV